MATRFRTAVAALVMGLLLCLPLRAQLDPRLQTSKTDFLNLYQQSTNVKVKPEILTIFDFSGSMEALMFHPLFVNTDTVDTGGSAMNFQYNPATTSFTITATSAGNTSSYGTLTFTVNSSTAPSTSSGKHPSSGTPSYTITSSSGSTTTPITVSPAGPYTPGMVVTLTTYLTTTGTSPNKGITWAASVGPAPIQTSAGTTNPYKFTATWTIPVTPCVTATLPITVGTSTLSSLILVKPDGTPVTATDAASASTSSGQYGASGGSSDVRNWVRAASHVRFAALVNTDIRTIDIPIPWKITNASSTGNPLSSATVLDRQVKTNPDNTTTTYGSGNNIEMDLNYAIASGSQVFSANTGSNTAGTNTTQTGTRLLTVTYRADYIRWLFSGKYTSGSYASQANNYIVFDAATLSLAAGQGALSWGQGYGSAAAHNNILVPNFNLDGTYAGTETSADATVNIVPGLSRVQAVKRAAISTWVQHQADVLWAFRFLDVGSEASNGNAININNSSTTTFNVTAGNISTYKIGSDSAWTVLNNTNAQGITSTTGNSVTGMARIAKLFANPSTPLTYAMARGLAQFTDPGSVFNAVEPSNTADAPSQCMNHFLILFTDGADNNGTGTLNGNTKCPYYIQVGSTSTYKISALDGNHSVMGTPANLIHDPSLANDGIWWNLFTYAGVAAHLGDFSLGAAGTDHMAIPAGGYPTGSALPTSFLPLAIDKRNGTIFNHPHLVTTMTVGVSLGGNLTNGPKRSLFVAAAVGDPTITNWSDASTLVPFQWDETANSGNGGRVSGSIYFFDATDPDKLSTSLKHAIESAMGSSNINTASAPTTPYIGSALGGELFIGKFQPPAKGGSIWTGDLLMFATKLVSDNLEILDKTGTVTTTVDTPTAQWSAYNALYYHRNWKDRKLYTRLAATSTTSNPGLSLFSDTGTPYTDPTTGLQNFVSRASNNPNRASYAVGSAAQKQVIQWAMGGDITKLDATSGRAIDNRNNIMGDIINSSPAEVEYLWKDVSSSLPTPLSSVTGGNHFRLILVGTNQGWLHAFGEVTKQDHAIAGDTSSPIIAQGAVDELWSFMPTDFLGYLDQLTVTSNPHRFLVDGPPTIYHLDLPPANRGAADGLVEVASDPGPERAMVIFGLGKGGRSYYAIDIHDPFNPVLKWSIVPDEALLKDATNTSLLQARILSRPGAPDIATVQKVIQNMGFSTCTPGIGRIAVTDSTGFPVMRDAVFLGGGFSLPETEVNFPDGSGNPTPMGRSVLAVDAYSGMILAAVDLSSSAYTTAAGSGLTPGPVYRGVVPFEFILNSGMAQRAYFLDYWGGLWSWGSQATDTVTTSPTYQYRIDSSDLSRWTADGTMSTTPGIRLVAKDMNGSVITASNYTTPQKYYSEALYTTLPTPFRVGAFPGHPKVAGGPVPATVGIAMNSGDRNNPLDFNYSAATKPVHHRLSMVFDRQDSLAWGSTANPIKISGDSTVMLDAKQFGSGSLQAGDAAITPNNDDYYLAPKTGVTKFGYFATFPDMSADLKLLPKGINTPAVVSGSLFYSYFFPEKADPCTGGTGTTYSNIICDVLNPIIKDDRKNMSCTSGNIWQPVGVASDYIPLGTRGVIQIGTTPVAGAPAGANATTLSTKTIIGNPSSLFPKARVWRTVH